MASEKKNKGGRPKIELDYEAIEKLSAMMCTQEEIASFLGCSRDTLLRDAKFCDIYKNGIEKGKMSIRRYQLECARKGNSAMLIWLGKQYLGQRDNIDISTEKLDEDAISRAIKESLKNV